MSNGVLAQSILSRTISLEIKDQRLENVLELMSNKANFFFSYNSNIIPADSLVSISAAGKTIRYILQTILGSGFEFTESGNYIILRRTLLTLRLVTTETVTDDRIYVVSGYVIDDQTGERLSDASIYEKQRLTAAITNNAGYFRLRLKSRYKQAAITVSKQFYEDTTVLIRPSYNQELTITLVPVEAAQHMITISPKNYEAPESIQLSVPINDSAAWLYTYVKQDSVIIERTTLSKFLVSSKQRIQSINLRKFFTARPYQVSITPGLSTNGKLNGQVINNFSFNVFGGYSGGVNGFELGGLFNIDKKNVQYGQVAGIFNLVGGNVTGLQIAGITNTVLEGSAGVQVGGITNYVNRGLKGVQIGGVYNHIGDDLKGVQVSGVTNFVNRTSKGVQVAGVANISTREMNGIQIGGVFNYARRLKGVQIGLINISDTSSGFSIGLINIVAKGYHKISGWTNEVMDVNGGFKTGNSSLYSILLGGYNTVPEQKLYSFGYGIGNELRMGRTFAFNTELTSQYLYRGSWDYLNLLNRGGIYLTIKFGKFFSIYGGPAYSVYVSDQNVDIAGYKSTIPPSSYRTKQLSNTVTGWFGWTAGLSFF